MYRPASHETTARRFSVVGLAFAARRWWLIVAVTTLVGALIGAEATKDPSYNSVLLVRVLGSEPNGATFEKAGQTALRLMQTEKVFGRAGEILGEDGGVLAAHTAITLITDTDLLEIQVSGESVEQTQRATTSIATAGRELMQDLSKEQVAGAALFSESAIASGVLPNGAAELARQQELGKSAATRQDAGLATALTLNAVGDPQSAPVGLSQPVAGAIGLLVGLLVGSAAAWLYGRRFGKLRRRGDLRETLPGVTVLEAGRLAGVAHRYGDGGYPLIGLFALPEAASALPELTTTLDAELRAEGRKPHLVQASDVRLQDTAVPSTGQEVGAQDVHSGMKRPDEKVNPSEVHMGNGRPTPRPRPTSAEFDVPKQGAPASSVLTGLEAPTIRCVPSAHSEPVGPAVVPQANPSFVPALGRGRDHDLVMLGCDTLVVSGGWEPGVVARLADRADAVLLVARRGATRLRDLAATRRHLGGADVVVVLT